MGDEVYLVPIPVLMVVAVVIAIIKDRILKTTHDRSNQLSWFGNVVVVDGGLLALELLTLYGLLVSVNLIFS